MTGDDLVQPLTDQEREQLAADEAIIENGFVGFLKVGMALARIRDSRAYRETHATFEDYCSKRWSLTRTRAYELMQAGAVATVVSEISNTPVEREGRPCPDAVRYDTAPIGPAVAPCRRCGASLQLDVSHCPWCDAPVGVAW